jgi:DNA-binding transcriptional ArsR family regulator
VHPTIASQATAPDTCQNSAAHRTDGSTDQFKNSTIWLTVGGGTHKLNQMVDPLNATFHALADPTRRAMLVQLARGERSMQELAEPFDMSVWGAAKHVNVLEVAGLVTRRKVGRSQLCRLRPAPLAQADRWLRQWERLWTTRLDRLEALLQRDKERKT